MSMTEPVARLLAIMARLRDPVNGCEWDVAQNFSSIAPYTIEEAYEVADAIARSDLADLRDELGDLLLQVVFHARMAEEAGAFDFADVAASIADKMERRHPHIFAGQQADGTKTIKASWERMKAEERAEKSQTGALDGVALAYPALMRAEKLQKRAARIGFDWPDTVGAADKLHEEIAEFASADTEEERVEEGGDLLFAAVNFLRKNGVSAEEALRVANLKFERRFAGMETLAASEDREFSALDLQAQDELWNRVKAGEKGRAT